MYNTKISTKFIKIIISISLIILIISSLISFFIMENIKKDTQRILGHKIEVKLENKINNSLQLGVTNAVSIANNQNIQNALINNDKEKTYQILNNLNNKYSKFTKYKKSKIHIHTHDVKSFLRSWDKNHNGDELSSFRETINYVKKTQKPVLDIEVGWANLVIRSIVPIIKDEKYIGSLEFIQDFEHIQKALENEDKYFFALIDKTLLKNKPTKEQIIDKYAISQSYYNRDFFKTLKTVNLDNLIKEGYISKDDKYFSIKPIIGFNNSFIGYYVIGEDLNKIKEIINQSQNITYFFLSLMLLMGIIIAFILHIFIKKVIISNLIELSDGVKNFFKFLNKEENNIKKINISTNDEIGLIADEINKNIELTKNLIDSENKENFIKEGIKEISKLLNKSNDITSITKNSINFLSEYTNSSVGVFYILNEDNTELNMYASYAYIQRDSLSNKFKLGEGVIGQVGLEKKPIQLKNIKRGEFDIQTGTTCEPPLNTYTFPLLYKDEIYGVIEIGSTEIFKEHIKKFFDLSSKIIATSLYTGIQNKKVKDLLKDTEQSNIELQKNQIQLEEVNSQMQEQQAQLEEANAQMQEQQTQLEEANAQMEEQQVQLQQSEKELKEQNKKLINSKIDIDKKAKDLEESNRYKSEFLANMSHELRTPLNSIILLSSMMEQNKKQNLEKDDIKKATIINNSGQELLRLINDVLDLSKVEAGKMELIIDKFHSNEFTQTIKELFETSAENKNLKFIVEDNYNDYIYNDKDKLSQVIRNFLSNSLKFTEQGFIKLILNKKDNDVEVLVEDSGIGIPKDKQNLVFQAFSQADGSTSRKYGGTGLGLSITKEFVKLMKGKITLKSQENLGSTFGIIIPNILDNYLEKQEEYHIIDDRDSLTDNSTPFLVIEDNITFAQTLKDLINNKDELCLIANNGKDGIKLSQKYTNIQGILLDLGLPDIDGVEVLKELKSNISTKKIPVYIISGKDDIEKSNIKGAIGFKQKPLNNDDFNLIVKDIKSFNYTDTKNLLVVEDDKIQREAMIEFISDKSINIKGVDNINDAIKNIKINQYDAIVIDLTLNNQSGLEICEYIKDNSLNIPIIVYTGKELTHQEENDINKFTDSIIIKSVNSQNRLLDEVNLFLHKVKSNKKDTLEPSTINNIKEDIDFEDKKILVVDDDMRNTFVLVEILEDKNAIVLTAQNGQEALDSLDENKDVDIILMDVMMPVMDGYEAIERIRKNDTIKNIPIIAITAKAMNKDKEKALEVGANDYLTKPLNLDSFVNVVNSWIK